MKGKITLVTPPDIYENSNTSVLFLHLNDADQDTVSQWLARTDIAVDVNIYMYTGEPNVPWLLYALSRCEYKYVDFDEATYITSALGSYILGKSDISYKASDENLAAIYSHINQNRVQTIEEFLERNLSVKTN